MIRIKSNQVSTAQVKLFRSLFKGRTDIYACYWTNFQQRKSGYAPVYSLNQKPKTLIDQVILDHLIGKQLIGIYPLLTDNTTHFLAIDFDKGNWLVESNKALEAAQKFNLSAYLERSKSGSGGHVWLFFKSAVPVIDARQLGKLLLEKANINKNKSYDRMFPSQDSHSQKGFGNLIALPLYGQAIKLNNSIFINKNEGSFTNQWQFLTKIKKIDKA